MAEKLGMIVLCKNCGKRIFIFHAGDYSNWIHENKKLQPCWCDSTTSWLYAQPRKESQW